MYLIIIISFLLLSYSVGLISDYFNIKNLKENLPEEFVGYYDEDKYKKSQNYLKDKTKFSFISTTIMLVLSIVFILVGGFNCIYLF